MIPSKPTPNTKTEEIKYEFEKDTYNIKLSFNSNEITINIKNSKPYQYNSFESKYNFSELKQISPFFTQFTDVEKIGNLFLNLLKGKKILISENQNIINFSFTNITEELIKITIKKKELIGDEKYVKLEEIVSNLINEVQQLKNENNKIKEENKTIKEELDQLLKFKLEIEEKKKNKKYHNLKNSSIIKDKEKTEMISNWIMPNRKIIYTQIYKATRDGGTGKDFHRYCDNKGPTLTLFESTNGYIFGGYISINWESPSSWTNKGNDDNAFIFSITNKLKFPIQDKSKVIYNDPNYGPDFGSNDIYLSHENFLNNDSQCSCNSPYNAPPEKLAGGKNFRIKDLEVYTVQFD